MIVEMVWIVEIVWNVEIVGMVRNIERVGPDIKFKKFSLMASKPSSFPASQPWCSAREDTGIRHPGIAAIA